MEKRNILNSNGMVAENKMMVPAVNIRGVGKLPLRLLDIKGVVDNTVDPKSAVIGAAQQTNDQASLILSGLYLLAKDVYSRNPEGSRHFQAFCEDIGLMFHDMSGKKTDPVKELASIL